MPAQASCGRSALGSPHLTPATLPSCSAVLWAVLALSLLTPPQAGRLVGEPRRPKPGSQDTRLQLSLFPAGWQTAALSQRGSGAMWLPALADPELPVVAALCLHLYASWLPLASREHPTRVDPSKS